MLTISYARRMWLVALFITTSSSLHGMADEDTSPRLQVPSEPFAVKLKQFPEAQCTVTWNKNVEEHELELWGQAPTEDGSLCVIKKILANKCHLSTQNEEEYYKAVKKYPALLLAIKEKLHHIQKHTAIPYYSKRKVLFIRNQEKKPFLDSLKTINPHNPLRYQFKLDCYPTLQGIISYQPQKKEIVTVIFSGKQSIFTHVHNLETEQSFPTFNDLDLVYEKMLGEIIFEIGIFQQKLKQCSTIAPIGKKVPANEETTLQCGSTKEQELKKITRKKQGPAQSKQIQ